MLVGSEAAFDWKLGDWRQWGDHSRVTGCSGKLTRTVDSIKPAISHQLANEKQEIRGRESNYLYPSSPHRIPSFFLRRSRDVFQRGRTKLTTVDELWLAISQIGLPTFKSNLLHQLATMKLTRSYCKAKRGRERVPIQSCNRHEHGQ
jgi:hypothetical protein